MAVWAWLFTLPGLLLTAFGVPGNRRYAGYASLAGPLVMLLVGRDRADPGRLGQRSQFANWLPFLPDGAFRTLADTLSALMLAILGFVAALVYVYSLGYMADDPGRRRFFVYLDLFVAVDGPAGAGRQPGGAADRLDRRRHLELPADLVLARPTGHARRRPAGAGRQRHRRRARCCWPPRSAPAAAARWSPSGTAQLHRRAGALARSCWRC